MRGYSDHSFGATADTTDVVLSPRAVPAPAGRIRTRSLDTQHPSTSFLYVSAVRSLPAMGLRIAGI